MDMADSGIARGEKHFAFATNLRQADYFGAFAVSATAGAALLVFFVAVLAFFGFFTSAALVSALGASALGASALAAAGVAGVAAGAVAGAAGLAGAAGAVCAKAVPMAKVVAITVAISLFMLKSLCLPVENLYVLV
ncbi:hypothetical protein [Noviherbaspirillum cavernae]|uniref:hypothetical protein n=1 Tax=Noviherbaspirillum cavernae TaxID=2320862 RepID=UPI001314A9E5|nr:hypothetical protein [Noviherbaspirillum cavernae]